MYECIYIGLFHMYCLAVIVIISITFNYCSPIPIVIHTKINETLTNHILSSFPAITKGK